MAKQKSPYQVGLGAKALNRARIVFGVLLILVIGSIGLVAYNEARSGSLQKAVVSPLKELAKSVLREFNSSTSLTPRSAFDFSYSEATTSGSNGTTVIINNGPATTTTNTKSNSTKVGTTPKATATPTTAPDDSYNQWVQQSNDWYAQSKAANDAWFQQQVDKNNSTYQQQTQQLDQANQDAIDKINADQEAWKKAHGL